MDHKSFRFEVKEINDQGQFTGYASVFGNEDLDGDIVVKGAFKRTIDHNKGVVPILWQHDQKEPIGINTYMVEDDHGLLVTGQLAVDTELGSRARSLLKLGAIKGLSIGYQVVQSAKGDKGVRLLKELRLFEYSVVTFPANPAAQVDAIKGAPMEHDFNAVLAQQQAERDLHHKRWHIEAAKDDAMDGIMSDESMSKEDKIKSADKCYDGYKSAMLDWHGQMIDAAPKANGDEKKAAKNPDLEKSRKLHMKAFDLTHQAMAMHHKAIDVSARTSYHEDTAAHDKTPPNPEGKKLEKIEGDPEELHSLTAALRETRLRIA